MTENKAIILIGVACLLFTGVAVPGLLALGVNSDGASLGMIVPIIVGGFAVGWVTVHYDEEDDLHKR